MAILIDLTGESLLTLSGLRFIDDSNPRMIQRMRTAINLEYRDGDNGTIYSTKETLPSILEQIEEFLKTHGLPYKFSSNIRNAASRHFSEKEEFEKFAEQARQKRDSEFPKAELRSFNASVKMLLRSEKPLKNHQILSAYHLAFAQNACNFSVPGAGKTRVVLSCFAYLNALLEEDPKHVNRLMVIGPLSSFLSWEQEYKECFGKDPLESVVRIYGGADRREIMRQLVGRAPRSVTLISMGSVVSNLDDIEDFLKHNKTMLVVDEAHKIKNIEGVTARSVLSISKEAKSRVVLTGTPAPNGYEDLYNIFEFIWPGKNVLGYGSRQLRDMTQRRKRGESDDRIEELYRNAKPFFIRVRKSDLGLPPCKTLRHNVPQSKLERTIYEKLLDIYAPQIAAAAKGTRVGSRSGLAKVLRLMQAATNPVLLKRALLASEFDIDGEDIIPINDPVLRALVTKYEKTEVPTKFKFARKIIDKELSAGGRVVVWSTFIGNINAFTKYLKDSGIATKSIHGGVPVGDDDTPAEIETRERIIKEFLDQSNDMNVLVANPQAAAESISLHHTCHRAIYLDRSFNAAHFMQSKDRIHRVGLAPGTMTYYDILLAGSTVDGVVDKRLEEKEAAMLEVVENEPIPLLDLNMTTSFGDVADLEAVAKNSGLLRR